MGLAFGGVVQGQRIGWSGNLNLNANLSQSVQDAQSVFVDFRAFQRYRIGNQLALNGFYILTRQTDGATKLFNTTEDRWTFNLKYDAPSSSRKFGFIDQRFDRNRIVELGLRSVTTAGFGYYPIRTTNPRTTGRVESRGDAEWRITAGLSYLTESFLNDLGNRNQTGFQLGSSFRKIFGRGISVNHVIDYFPAIENPEDFFVISNLSVGFPITQRVGLNLSWISDFDSTPAPGTRKDNNKYALSLGFSF